MCVYFCVGLWVKCPQRSEWAIRCPGAGVRGGYEVPGIGAGEWTWVPGKGSTCSYLLSHLFRTYLRFWIISMFVLFLIFFSQCRSFELPWNSDAYLPPDPVWLENFASFFYSVFKAKTGSWKQRTDEFCFLIHSVNPCLLPGALIPLIFKFTIEMLCRLWASCCWFLLLFVFLVVLCVLIIMAWYFVFIVSCLWTPFSINNSAINNSYFFRFGLLDIIFKAVYRV